MVVFGTRFPGVFFRALILEPYPCRCDICLRQKRQKNHWMCNSRPCGDHQEKQGTKEVVNEEKNHLARQIIHISTSSKQSLFFRLFWGSGFPLSSKIGRNLLPFPCGIAIIGPSGLLVWLHLHRWKWCLEIQIPPIDRSLRVFWGFL